MPTLAWGVLGTTCGLYEMYLDMLADLAQHLDDMGQHLDLTGSALTSNAQAYKDIDQQIASAPGKPGTETGMSDPVSA